MVSHYFWVLIPITAILSGTLKSWLRLKARQQALGASTHELEREVAALRTTRAELVERIENLEAIVVSQTWGALHEKGLSPAEQERKVAAAARRELAPPPEPAAAANQQRAEQLAQRLR
jgi:peptidoglycan hydrolase CwlO-like protein